MRAKKYRWAAGVARRIKVDPQDAGERFEAIRAKHGHLTPALVLDDARRKTSPLHKAFEWDNKSAAEGFRLQQASYLLRSIEVVVVMEKRKPAQPIRAFLNVKQDGQKGYQPVAKVMSDEDLRYQILMQAHNEVVDWRRRFIKLSEFSRVFAEIDRVPVGRRKKAA